MTKAEVILWSALRGRKLGGLRFRRQHPIGPFILDFYCDAAHLCIELDGSTHEFEARAQHDAKRDAWLRRRGIRVLRLPAEAVIKDPESVLQAIVAAAPSVRLRRLHGSADSSPRGGA